MIILGYLLNYLKHNISRISPTLTLKRICYLPIECVFLFCVRFSEQALLLS